MFGWGNKQRDPKGLKEPEPGKQSYGIPTVKFDPATVTETVKADLQQNVKSLGEIGPHDFDAIYKAALRAITAGFDMYTLTQVLLTIEGMSKRRAAEISRSLSFKANALMVAEQQERLGIKYAIWRYSGAPCGDRDQDAVHKAADGKPYLVSKGMLLNGQWTRPGREDGCKCFSSPLVAGFDGYDGGKPEGLKE